jgi:prepilin-type N-terminal cleavage/methylation domain-containing protein
MNKKGFTLVELLAAIVILAVILAVAVPTVGNIISSSQNQASKASENLILKSAQTYLALNGKLPVAVGDCKYIDVQELIDNNILDAKTKEPRFNRSISGNNIIFVKKISDSGFEYKYLAVGQIKREVWLNYSNGITGLATITASPDIISYHTTFQIPSNFADAYGTRMTGYLIPPITGDYKFWVASDNDSQLWLSSDDTMENVSLIASLSGWTGTAEWNKYVTQESPSITLEAGKIYFIKAYHIEGSSGDHLSVAWQIPSGMLEVIPGQYLAPYFPD